MAIDIDKYTIKANWGTQFNPVAQFPVIANRIFKTLAEATAYLSDTSDSRSAIPGLILRVIEDSVSLNNGAYLVVEDESATSTNKMRMTKLMTGDIDIKFEVVWAVKDPSTGEWRDVEEGTPGAVQCLKLIHGESATYVPLSQLVVLKDYAKIADVNASLFNLNASVQTHFEKVEADVLEAFTEIDDVKERIADLSTYIDDFEDLVDRRFEAVDSSMLEAFNDIDELNKATANLYEHVVEIDTEIENIKVDVSVINTSIYEIECSVWRHDELIYLHDRVLGKIVNEVIPTIDSSINQIEYTLENNVVNSIDASTDTKFFEVEPVERTTGDVTISINASVCDVYDEKNTDMEGFVTANYLEGRFQWVEVD